MREKIFEEKASEKKIGKSLQKNFEPNGKIIFEKKIGKKQLEKNICTDSVRIVLVDQVSCCGLKIFTQKQVWLIWKRRSSGFTGMRVPSVC